MKKGRVSLRFVTGIIIFYLISFTVTSQETKPFNYSDPESWLLGYFQHDDLLSSPHKAWYNSGFDSYTFDSDVFMKLSGLSYDDVTITIVLGTWCPDSRRELPRFLKIMQSWGITEEQITLVGVDSYKVAPIENYDKLNIERVPTFIIYKNKIEAGRIIEYPKTSLEQDMVNILTEKE
ncbi:MAG: thioredoxin [Bacteroidia bacterium]|nr:MAG: thioredoxin [Bacteroidia bacterium]